MRTNKPALLHEESKKLMKNAYITIHTDGACLGNPGPGGWAAILRRYSDGEEVKARYICNSCPDTTNNRMELTAALKGFREIASDETLPIIVSSDSKYLVQGMTEWSPKWVARNWKSSTGKPVANKDLWVDLLAACEGLDVTWQWVRGHSGDPRNEEADRLASRAAESAKANS